MAAAAGVPATGTVPPSVATVDGNVVDKGGAAAAAAHGSTALANCSTAAAVGVPVRGAAAAAGVSAGDSQPTVCRRPWTRSLAASQRPVAGLMAHSGHAGVALVIDDEIEPSTLAEVGPSVVEARPVAAEAPARPSTRASAAAVAAAALPTRRATRASRAANGATSEERVVPSGARRAPRRSLTDGPGRSRRPPGALQPPTVMEADADAADRGGGAGRAVGSSGEADEPAMDAQERARMRAGRKRWFTEHRGTRGARRGPCGVGGATEGVVSTREATAAPMRQRRGRGAGRPGRGRTDPGVDIDLVVADADALVLARPDRPRAARVPVHKGPRARTTVPPPTAAGAALAAREEDIPLPRRRPTNTASMAANHLDEEVDDEEEAPPSSAPAGISRTHLHLPSAAARASPELGGSHSDRGRPAQLRTGRKPPAITIPPEWEQAKSLKEKLLLRAAIRHAVRDRVRHYMNSPSFADDVYHGEADSAVMFRKAIERTFGCSKQQARWLLTKRLPPNEGRMARVAAPAGATSPTVPPPGAPAASTDADATAPTPPAPATAPRKRRVRLDDPIQGICCRARSNVHHSIGRTVVKAWSAGSTFDAPLNTNEEDDNGVPVPPLTNRTEKAKWWLRGRRYFMTVRGRKGFVEAYRAFKNTVGRTHTSPGRARVAKKTGGSGVEVDGDRLVATRAQLAWISVKVRMHLRPWTDER